MYSQVEDLSTTKILSELPAIITLLRLLKHYGCPPCDNSGAISSYCCDTDKLYKGFLSLDEANGLKWSVAAIAFFSSNAMEVIIRLLQVCCADCYWIGLQNACIIQ